MNASVTAKENVLHSKHKSLNQQLRKRSAAVIRQKDNWSLDEVSGKIHHLLKSINTMCDESSITLDEILKSSNSTLGKLYQLFLSLTNNEDHLLDQEIVNNFIFKNTEGLITKLNQINKNPMNFIQFIKYIQHIAKENQFSNEYLYEKLLRPTCFIDNQNQNNNALDSSNILLDEYNKDLFRLEQYFIKYSEKSNDNSYSKMNCSTFIKCICQNRKLNKVYIRLELNGLFYQILSLLIDQGVYISGSITIDFYGFLLCLQQISRIFHFNLRALIKNLINKHQK
ncbi:unnamed protein product [Adineta steineri]|uniref:Uncharacterized protein n=1 Tax=Adineta steineri TaxID=433720 RepID=A0A813Y7H4_9BILA|nr:unnamed protein product [Adineta steineri]